jgi:hypothetical protein
LKKNKKKIKERVLDMQAPKGQAWPPPLHVQLTTFLCPRHGTKGNRKKPSGKADYRLLPCPSVSLSLKNLSAINPRSLGPIAKPAGEARTLYPLLPGDPSDPGFSFFSSVRDTSLIARMWIALIFSFASINQIQASVLIAFVSSSALKIGDAA